MAPVHTPPSARRLRSASGFTLIEIMVVVALVAILASLAIPSWTQLRLRSEIRSTVNDLSLSLQFARAQAVQLNSPVTVCPSNDGNNCTATGFHEGWIVRIGPALNANGQRILKDVLPRNSVNITTNAVNGRFTFLPNGGPASNFVGATLAVCPALGAEPALSRRLVINRGGRVRVESPNVCAL